MSVEYPIPAQSDDHIGTIILPDCAAIAVNARDFTILTTDGEMQTLPHSRAPELLDNKVALVCHAPYVKERLGFENFYTFDVLELFAFTHPSQFCIPTPVGLTQALHINAPSEFEDHPFALFDIARTLLKNLTDDPLKSKADPLKIAAVMGLKGKGWAWTPFITKALGETYNPDAEMFSKSALNVWKHLPEWSDDAPAPPPSHHGVTPQEAEDKLGALLNTGDKAKEPRPQQKNYTRAIAEMFAPMREDENPHIILAEAGTGVGKTLGYLAPASVWAEKNEGAVWISTYTKNLQRQINDELDRLYPHPVVKDAYTSVRKGRENYLCLLNLDDAAAGAGLSHNPHHVIAAGIMARWAAATRDGDLTGSGFPGWLSGILGYANTYGLADRRGECIYSACDHYKRCFVERSVRKAKKSRLVIANHALVMIQSAMAGGREDLPTRYIFDEGHHLFDAADSAFAAHLTARETADLRRWILGREGAKKGRARGLKKRIEDLTEGDEHAAIHLQDIIQHANALCADGWSRRFKDRTPKGPAEGFMMEIYRVVNARNSKDKTPYSIETELFPIDADLAAAGKKLEEALTRLLIPMDALAKRLNERLINNTVEIDSDTRKRLDSLISSLEYRGKMTLTAWIEMLKTLQQSPEKNKEALFIDWLEITRVDGISVDVGFYRHHIDPMSPFSASMRPHLHGMTVTSATLQDRTEDEAHNWHIAAQRSGAQYLTAEPHKSSHTSPFDYKNRTKVFIINDVNKNNLAQVAAAYRTLFTASNGGALGLFTAISRLRAVYEKITLPLEEHGIPVYGQHIDKIDTGTLIDMFRADETACLLGTDAVRDGVDVPGKSLRLLVFDRVPWPRPTILHKARRNAFGKRQYDEMLTRLKLKQAFGRLIRRADDKGVFVMLDPMLPSRLHSAFPSDVEIIKCGITEASAEIATFLDVSTLK